MNKAQITAGQRWVSDSEPEMGLGMILQVEHATLEVLFPAVQETRRYAIETAPLRRVVFKKGEQILTHQNKELEVIAVLEDAGLITYLTDVGSVPEAELSEAMGFSKPQDRLLGAQVDENSIFQLRAEALYRQNQIQKSPIRGHVGGRTDLLSHQISIVHEVSKRLKPRVLLADEVGLGKTIEACMIMHRLYQTGRADRVLILLPEPLINQWFVELLRRFNMLFSLFDEERCDSIQANHPEQNPFLDSQLVIASVDFLTNNGERAQQARDAGWDLLIVDEAHHLEWHVDEVSAEYALVESFASVVPGLLLLSATPQQLGAEGHFARLKLLDPERYTNLDSYLAESDSYAEVAKLVELIENDAVISSAMLEGYSDRVRKTCEEWLEGKAEAKQELIQLILDSFGTGRVMFRNTRQNLSGFPERKAHLIEIEESDDLNKVDCLVHLIKELAGKKVLLICRTKEQVIELASEISERINIKLSQFHEDLSLNQRDRNAAYFAEKEGAQLLLCSEIGSEGRNFQFAHHLVLYDLPKDPELLEQRIGRLDRIGQKETINIHVPFAGWSEKVWADWYHVALGAFEENVHGASEIFAEFAGWIKTVVETGDKEEMQKLIAATHERKREVGEKLSEGYDKLLELNSHRPESSAKIIETIKAADDDGHFENFILRMLDQFGVDVEDLEQRNYLLKPGRITTDAFPDIPDEGLSVTFDRSTALSREELQFMTMDHPITRACFDLMLSSEVGNSSFGVWEAQGEKKILLECYFVVESMAPSALHVDRFMPTTPIRVAVDHEGNDLSNDRELARARLRQGSVRKLLDKPVIKSTLLPKMIEQSERLAEEKMQAIMDAAHQEVFHSLEPEIARLSELAEINPQVNDADVADLVKQRGQITEAIRNARLRPDAIRMIWKETA